MYVLIYYYSSRSVLWWRTTGLIHFGLWIAVGDTPTVVRQLLSYQVKKFGLGEMPFSMVHNIRTIEVKMTTLSKPKETWKQTIVSPTDTLPVIPSAVSSRFISINLSFLPSSTHNRLSDVIRRPNRKFSTFYIFWILTFLGFSNIFRPTSRFPYSKTGGFRFVVLVLSSFVRFVLSLLACCNRWWAAKGISLSAWFITTRVGLGGDPVILRSKFRAWILKATISAIAVLCLEAEWLKSKSRGFHSTCPGSSKMWRKIIISPMFI